MSIQAAECRLRVSKILRDERLNQRGKGQALWNYIQQTEVLNGSQFLYTSQKQLYIVIGLTNEVIMLPRAGRGGDRWFSYYHSTYGLTEHESFTKTIYDALRAYVIEHGTKVDVRRFAAYQHETKTAYLSAYNGRMYKIDGSDITDAACGEDGVFFIDDDNGVHCDPDIGPHGRLIDRLTSINFAAHGLSGITAEQQRMALIIWLFALALPDFMPTKPILLLEGQKGSGKTAAIVLTQLALMGASLPMILQKNKEDDFGTILLRSPIALFDNTDSYIEWVPDAICSYTTGGVWNKRKLYTDDESMVIRPHAFIAIATRNPASFRRDDVADRCVILRLERRASFIDFHQLQQQVLDERCILLGEYMWFIGQIINEIRANTAVMGTTTHRMADFAALGNAVGKIMGWEISAIEELMLALQGERDAFINEEDPLVDLLQKWIAYKPRNAPANVGKIITIFQLHAELETFAQANSLLWKDSPRSLAQKIRSTHIEREFHIETHVVNGHKAFAFWRHSDPRLKVVDDSFMPEISNE